MSINFDSTNMLVQQVIFKLAKKLQIERRKKINNLKKKIYENSKK